MNLLNMNYYQGRQESRMFILQNFIMYLDTSNSSTLVCTIFSSFKYANILTYACSEKMCSSSTGFIYLNNLSLRLQLMNYYQDELLSRSSGIAHVHTPKFHHVLRYIKLKYASVHHF